MLSQLVSFDKFECMINDTRYRQILFSIWGPTSSYKVIVIWASPPPGNGSEPVKCRTQPQELAGRDGSIQLLSAHFHPNPQPQCHTHASHSHFLFFVSVGHKVKRRILNNILLSTVLRPEWRIEAAVPQSWPIDGFGWRPPPAIQWHSQAPPGDFSFIGNVRKHRENMSSAKCHSMAWNIKMAMICRQWNKCQFD